MNQGMDQPTPDEQRLAEQGRDAIARAVADTRAPLHLRERIEADRARLRRTRRRRSLLAPAAAFAVLVALVVVGLLVNGDRHAIGGGRGGRTTVLAVAALGERAPTSGAPRRDPAKRGSLDVAVGDLAFPAYAGGPPPAGARADLIAGAQSRTVYYARPDRTRIAYTIVRGTQLPGVQGARLVRWRGRNYRVARAGDRLVVFWELRGNTCVLSAPAGVGADALLRLAWYRT